MSRGTQLDLFEPLHAAKECKDALKSCSKQLADFRSFCLEQQKSLSKFYLTLKQESDAYSTRLSELERLLK